MLTEKEKQRTLCCKYIPRARLSAAGRPLTLHHSGDRMRCLILLFCLLSAPSFAEAASIHELDGAWSIDLAATLKAAPEIVPDESLPTLKLIINAKAGQVRTELSGTSGPPKSFVVEREDAAGIVIKRADGKMLHLKPSPNNRLAVGELRGEQTRNIIYFIRAR